MWLCVVGFSPCHSWRRVLLVSLVLRVVDVMVLLWLLVLSGVMSMLRAVMRMVRVL